MKNTYKCSNCLKVRLQDFPISDETNEKYCPDCNWTFYTKPKGKVKFFKPKPIRTSYGQIVDSMGVYWSVKERGLDGECEKGGYHDWLLLPVEPNQKEYCVCLKCTMFSHL